MRPTFFWRYGLLASTWITSTWAGQLARRESKNPVHFTTKLTWGKGAPDGFERDMIFVNGEFPGPTLWLNEGDDVEFVVENQLPFNTTMHFHGIEQLNTPWSDGVPGLSQAHITPGSSFNYKWTATQYGTYWYHGHSRGHIADGLYGAIHIRPAKDTSHPFAMISEDEETIQQIQEAVDKPEIMYISDWSHFTSEALFNVSLESNVDTMCWDSLLINGKGSVQCPGVDFFMSVTPDPQLSVLAGEILTDKGCLPVTSPLGQTRIINEHDLSLVPDGLFTGCQATNGESTTIVVDPAKGWVSLNMIASTNLQDVAVSIDDHPMWVYAADGRYIEPTLVDAMNPVEGSRHAVLIQLDQPARDYTIRIAGTGLNQKVTASATLSYLGGSKENIPNPSISFAGVNTTADVTFLDDTKVVPFPALKPAAQPDQTFKLVLNRTANDPVAAWKWTINGNYPYDISLENDVPLLLKPNGLSNTSLVITTQNNTWVDLIFTAVKSDGIIQPHHPMHKHSSKVFVLGQGKGDFPWVTVADAMKDIPSSFNLENPSYRDGFYTLPVLTESSWVAVRYNVVNPGAFLLHCHVNSHMTGGMSIAILDGIDTWPIVPAEYAIGQNGFPRGVNVANVGNVAPLYPVRPLWSVVSVVLSTVFLMG